VNKNIYNS